MNTSAVLPVATHFSLASGMRVLDRFTIERGLGMGGFGEVYFALSDAGKEVALKRIQRNVEVELRGVAHCLNLKHPHLISLFDVCQDASAQWWVVMEYVAGPSLRERLAAAPTGLAAAEVQHWFTPLAAAVDYLHQQGLVHRDLKPGNLFDDGGVVKVGDYGLSKYISQSQRGGQTESIGTFHYMAPEVGRGEYGREIDIYALGVILYEMVTGRLPFEGETYQEIAIKHLCSPPDLCGVPQPYHAVIERAMNKDPARRWDSAAQMAAALGGDGAMASAAAGKSPVVRAELVSGSRDSGDPAGRLAVAEAAVGPPSLPLWRSLWHSPWVRAVLVALVLVMLLRAPRGAVPLLALVALVSAPGWVLWQLGIERRKAPPQRSAHPVPVRAAPVRSGPLRPGPLRPGPAYPVPARPVKLTLALWRQHKRRELAHKRASVRLAELTGSYLAAAIAAVFCGGAAAVIGLRHAGMHPLLVAPYAWVAVTAFAAAVVILALGKVWEGRDGDPLNRRLALAGGGALVGALAYAAAHHLLIPLSGDPSRALGAVELPRSLARHGPAAALTTLVAHFALLGAAVRWWKLTDPLRAQRLSLWAVAVVVVAQWLIHLLVPTPQPWGMVIAGVTVIIVQIGAAWESPEHWKQDLAGGDGGAA